MVLILEILIFLADSSYYGGYKRDLSDDDEPRRKTRNHLEKKYYQI